MADRLAEKADNAKEGKMKRVTAADIRPSQRDLKAPKLNGVDEESKLIGEDLDRSGENRLSTGSASGRRTPKLNQKSPSFQKFDANLKK